jgi:FMN-dependent oxidoreductase (nitrilotriacetate monooxygenase family)
MHLGVFAIGTGNHVAGWRLPGAGTSNEDLQIFFEIARAAERGKFDFVFISDNVACSLDDLPGYIARLEPVTLLSALSVVTERIGLVATASTTYSEPYNLARAFASLDHISNGRAGWNAVTTSTPEAAANFSRTKAIPHDLRYEVATEFVEVVKGLWDSWEEGARVADKSSGTYIDRSRVHQLDYSGKFHSVRGPLNCSRSPQGHPVIVQAGSSSSGQEFSARFAEVMFTVQQDLADARGFYSSMKSRVIKHGREESHLKILPGFLPVVGRTEAEAKDKMKDLVRFIDQRSAMAMMSERFGHDMSKYPLDGPVPELPLTETVQSYARVFFAMARRQNCTLRDILNLVAVARGYLIACGTVDQVADVMEEWFVNKGADGFMLIPAHFPGALNDFVDLVVPELQRRNLFRHDYEGSTLRDHFKLPIPLNRYTAAAKPAAGMVEAVQSR